MKTATKLWLTASGLAAAATSASSFYLYNYAFKRLNKIPAGSASNPDPDSKFYPSFAWFEQQDKQTWWLHENDPQNKIHSYFLENNQTNVKKVAIISHGYKGSAPSMAASAKLFYDDGYSVVLPDNRSHGLSAGKYINFGWLDRLDYLDWIQKVIAYMGTDVQIVLYGVSMGGATVMMLSGDELPVQVKAIVEDCGYSSIEEELAYQLKETFKLPKFPLIPVVSQINKVALGFSLKGSSAIEQLKKNTTPIFFIHGEKDTYVPTYMCFDNYQATTAPKDIWIVPNATHAASYWAAPEEYTFQVKHFLSKYVAGEQPV
ncbi:alpha/beta hydrolase [Agrilactobacillus fermenti]|uniref:alpha/beta hydrolase n=1 Tax=Agrilactobacillus fermenti TaxID=2586909 RepID=UPI001E5B3C49|nr:alpha/beta hydrolase [Agrilactobacillus fermenti]MCD2256148.1 alpha/beta hydrolase [Agrilactobacillus fermenti]